MIATAELQLHSPHVSIEIDGVPIHPLEEVRQQRNSDVGLHVHHYVYYVETLDLTLQVLLAYLAVQLSLFELNELLHLGACYHSSPCSLLYGIDNACTVVLDYSNK